MKGLLDRLGYRYQFQKGFLSGGVMFIADFYLPKPRKIVLEIDGDSHLSTRQAVKDALRDAYFAERGLRVIRMTNREAEALTLDELRGLIGIKKVKVNTGHDDDPASQFKRFM